MWMSMTEEWAEDWFPVQAEAAKLRGDTTVSFGLDDREFCLYRRALLVADPHYVGGYDSDQYSFLDGGDITFTQGEVRDGEAGAIKRRIVAERRQLWDEIVVPQLAMHDRAECPECEARLRHDDR